MPRKSKAMLGPRRWDESLFWGLLIVGWGPVDGGCALCARAKDEETGRPVRFFLNVFCAASCRARWGLRLVWKVNN